MRRTTSTLLRDLEQRVSEMVRPIAASYGVDVAVERDDRGRPSVAIRVKEDGSGKVQRRRNGRKV